MAQLRNTSVLIAAIGLLSACNGAGTETSAQAPAPVPAPVATPVETTRAASGQPFMVTEVAEFHSPWAMTFLPDDRLLVTEMGGTLRLYDPATDTTGSISGVPEVVHVAQGGLGDVVLHPDYEDNELVYISYVESGNGGLGAVVARARLTLDDQGGGALEDLEVVWRQTPKKSGDGHFGYRIVFDDDGMLWISSSERKEFDPAQDLQTNLGKIVRLNDDGSVPDDNPFAEQGEVAAQAWTLGHRNVLGLAFDGDGQL